MDVEEMATLAYEGICQRASKMVEEAFPGLDGYRRTLVEAGIAAGVTAAITAIKEAGLLK